MSPETRRALARLGGIVLVAVASFTALFMYTTGRTMNASRMDVWVAFPSADGLRKGDAVLYRGVTVGQVRSIQFAPGSGVLAELRVSSRTPVGASATAALVAADMFGRQSVVLSDAASARPLAGGDTLRGAAPVTLTSRVDGMTRQLERLVSDSTVDALHALLSAAQQAAAATSLVMVASGEAISRSGPGVDALLRETATIAANLGALTDTTGLLRLRESVTTGSDQLAGLIAQLDTTARTLRRSSDALAAGDGTLGRLLADPELYERAVITLAGVDSLLADVKRNPGRYISLRVF